MKKYIFMVLLLLLFFTSPVLGQAQEVEIENLLNSPNSYQGKNLKLLVKISSALGGVFSCYETNRMQFFIEDASLRNRADYELSVGDNVYFWGKVYTSPNLRFMVSNFAKGKSDEDIFQDQYEKLVAKGDYSALKRLGDRTTKKGNDSKNPNLVAMAQKAYESYLAFKERDPKALKGFKNKFTHAIEYFLLAKNREESIKLLMGLYNNTPSKQKEIRKILQDPQGLRCIEIYSGKGRKWLRFEDFRKQKGLLEYEGKWISRDKVIFEDFLRDYLKGEKSSLYFNFSEIYKPNRGLGNFDILIDRGDLGTAMEKEELLKSWGYPEIVYNRSDDSRKIEMWVYSRSEHWYDNTDGKAKKFESPRFYIFLEGGMAIKNFSLKEIETDHKKERN